MSAQHRHSWEPAEDGGFVCPDCPATAAACVVCQRVCEVGRTCESCVSRARNDVREVRDLYRQLPDVIASIAGLHAVRYDRAGRGSGSGTRITGGEAMVLAVDARIGGEVLGRHESSVDPSLLAAERADPPSVLAILTWWEDCWRDERHETGADRTTVEAASTYLVTHMEWAAQKSGLWDDYRADVRSLLFRLRNLTGNTTRPVRSRIPCVVCGGATDPRTGKPYPVIRKWTDTGLSEVHECTNPACRASWPTATAYSFVQHLRALAAPMTDPDLLVTVEQARAALPDLRRNTLNQILKRDRDRAPEPPRLPQRGRTVRGEPLYRLGDITNLVNPEEQTA